MARNNNMIHGNLDRTVDSQTPEDIVISHAETYGNGSVRGIQADRRARIEAAAVRTWGLKRIGNNTFESEKGTFSAVETDAKPWTAEKDHGYNR